MNELITNGEVGFNVPFLADMVCEDGEGVRLTFAFSHSEVENTVRLHGAISKTSREVHGNEVTRVSVGLKGGERPLGTLYCGSRVNLGWIEAALTEGINHTMTRDDVVARLSRNLTFTAVQVKAWL